jgi:hypothetical protein
MLLALAIFFGTALTAAAIAVFVLHLKFRSTQVDSGSDAQNSHGNWAAHRACPQGLPHLKTPSAARLQTKLSVFRTWSTKRTINAAESDEASQHALS